MDDGSRLVQWFRSWISLPIGSLTAPINRSELYVRSRNLLTIQKTLSFILDHRDYSARRQFIGAWDPFPRRWKITPGVGITLGDKRFDSDGDYITFDFLWKFVNVNMDLGSVALNVNLNWFLLIGFWIGVCNGKWISRHVFVIMKVQLKGYLRVVNTHLDRCLPQWMYFWIDVCDIECNLGF